MLLFRKIPEVKYVLMKKNGEARNPDDVINELIDLFWEKRVNYELIRKTSAHYFKQLVLGILLHKPHTLGTLVFLH